MTKVTGRRMQILALGLEEKDAVGTFAESDDEVRAFFGDLPSATSYSSSCFLISALVVDAFGKFIMPLWVCSGRYVCLFGNCLCRSSTDKDFFLPFSTISSSSKVQCCFFLDDLF